MKAILGGGVVAPGPAARSAFIAIPARTGASSPDTIASGRRLGYLPGVPARVAAFRVTPRAEEAARPTPRLRGRAPGRRLEQVVAGALEEADLRLGEPLCEHLRRRLVLAAGLRRLRRQQ